VKNIQKWPPFRLVIVRLLKALHLAYRSCAFYGFFRHPCSELPY